MFKHTHLPLRLDPVSVAMVLQPSDLHVCICLCVCDLRIHTLTFNSFLSATCKHSGISALRAYRTKDILTLAVAAGGSVGVFVCLH